MPLRQSGKGYFYTKDTLYSYSLLAQEKRTTITRGYKLIHKNRKLCNSPRTPLLLLLLLYMLIIRGVYKDIYQEIGLLMRE